MSHSPDPLDIPVKLWLARMAHGVSPSSVFLAYADWSAHLAVSPSKLTELIDSAIRYALCMGEGSPRDSHSLHTFEDKRFTRPEWQTSPFREVAKAFLLQQRWWAQATSGVHGVSPHHEQVVAFTARQWLDMWSPSNFIGTNPQVLQETMSTGGANLANGLANWWRDAQAVAGNGAPRGVENFTPGRSVAITPGTVVYRNHLIELIQYKPSTAMVKAEPVLIVPSWIMKYYILDLTPGESLVKYLVDRGHTVFMISWNNPGGEDRDLGMDDYLQMGVLDALHVVQEALPDAPVHAVGYCLGGTLLSMAAASLAHSRWNPLRTVTLLAAQTDFEEPGELGLFIDESQIAFVEDLMAERGYLDGREMAGAFQLINSKDLVWSKLVHEYLMGAQTPMTALRAWNADATRLPARMHSEYLRRLYLGNDLAQGRYRVAGKLISLSNIRIPMFVVATDKDHVSPWHSVYKIHGLVHGPVTFALASGGHNVGIVNPPASSQAHVESTFRIASAAAGRAPADPEKWLMDAVIHDGSWWPEWAKWLARHSTRGEGPPPPQLNGCAAPGIYVHRI